MSPHGVFLGIAILAIIAALVTGHQKVALGMSACLVVLIVLFYAAVVYALRKWSNGGNKNITNRNEPR
ncbi:hypothetical protein ATCVCanal1_019R [Acanthocystis turfacea Chlorella virus Canal-1]|nr:hypothetical protein ATCVCanal1_019R [Acanthocystis turfacea Chlorella virus Canal-1]